MQIRYDGNLWNYLKKFRNNSNLALTDRLELFLRIGQAVEKLQKAELIHLDIKPSNVLLNYDQNISGSNVNRSHRSSIGSAFKKRFSKNISSKTYGNFPLWNPQKQKNLVLADFGLSGDLKTCSKNAGTPGFGSPEQMIGRVHPKSDLYALGKLAIIILFEWDVAWSLLAKPKTGFELKAENIHGTKFQKIIADLLQVQKYFRLLLYKLSIE